MTAQFFIQFLIKNADTNSNSNKLQLIQHRKNRIFNWTLRISYLCCQANFFVIF